MTHILPATVRGKLKNVRAAFWLLGFLLFLALARDILANGWPLYCRIGGETYWPGLRLLWAEPGRPFADPTLESIRINNAWKTYPYEAAVFAPIPFSPAEITKPPFPPATGPVGPGTLHPGLPPRFRHWLGTDDVGRDVAAGLVSGARVAVWTGVTAMAMALGIGLFLGAMAGFWGDNRLRARRGVVWMTAGGLFPAWFYTFPAREYLFTESGTWSGWWTGLAIFAGIVLLFYVLGRLLSRLPFFNRIIRLPVDMVVMRLSEVFNAVPALIFIYFIAALLPKDKQSLGVLIALIGAVSWPGAAIFIRADLLRVRELDYVTAARGMGFSNLRILLRHALPNALRSTRVAFALGVASAVLLEASLSFLGFGNDTFSASWGTLLNSARAYPTAWWVALPPGLAICLTVLSLQTIGDWMSDRKNSASSEEAAT